MRKAMKPMLVSVAVSLLLVGCSENQRNSGGVSVNNNDSVITSTSTQGTETKIEGSDIATAMLQGQYELLYSQFSEEMKSIISLQDFKDLAVQFVADVERFELSSTTKENGQSNYVWIDASNQKAVTAFVDEQHAITGLQILPLTSYPETDEQYSQTQFQLPFTDEWLVYWGGKNVLLNYHYEYEHVRYAYDYIIVKDGYSYSGDPRNNESYYAFGAEVLAPADGEVIAVVDGIVDNIPGEMNEEHPAGNMVVIQHDNGELSMLAHFKQNSISVKEGDTVQVGQLLGLCGNSGNSSEAHIHFQVMKQAEDGSELVVPISFVDGKEWVRGDQAKGQEKH